MAKYCFKCNVCGRTEIKESQLETPCPNMHMPGGFMARDYQAENVGIGSGVRESRMSKERQETRVFSEWAEREGG